MVGCCSSYLVGWLLPLKHDDIRGSVEWRAKKRQLRKKRSESSGSSYLVGWLVVNFKASLERICGMAGKEEEAAAQAVLIWLVGCCL